MAPGGVLFLLPHARFISTNSISPERAWSSDAHDHSSFDWGLHHVYGILIIFHRTSCYLYLFPMMAVGSSRDLKIDRFISGTPTVVRFS